MQHVRFITIHHGQLPGGERLVSRHLLGGLRIAVLISVPPTRAMLFRQLFDPSTSTYTYLLADPDTAQAVLIDPVLDQMERDLALLAELGLTLVHTLETHAHADHITAGGALRERVKSTSVVGRDSGVTCADRHVTDGDEVRVGAVHLEVRATPGHTAGCIAFVTKDHRHVFTGDALLIRGCGRTDFQDGDAGTLYRSVHERLFSLPAQTQVWPGHDYRGHTSSTILEERRYNHRLNDSVSEAAFVQIMASLDLPRPKRLDEAVPANLRCGLAAQTADHIDRAERGWAPIARSANGVPELGAGWVRENAATFRIVDVRDPSEHATLAPLPGSETVPLEHVERWARDWDREAPLILTCRSGRRSGLATLMLEEMGFKRVASMAGGLGAGGCAT